MLIREVRYSFLMRVTTHEVCECTEGRLCYFRNRCLNSMSSCNPFQLILGKLIFFFGTIVGKVCHVRGRGAGFSTSVLLLYSAIESIPIPYHLCNLKFDLVSTITGNRSETTGGHLFSKSYVLRALVKGKCA